MSGIVPILQQYNPNTVDQGTNILPIYRDTNITIPGTSATTPASSTHACFGYAHDCTVAITGQIFRINILSQRLLGQILGSQSVQTGDYVFIVPVRIKNPWTYLVVLDSYNNITTTSPNGFAYMNDVLGIDLNGAQAGWFYYLYNNCRVRYNTDICTISDFTTIQLNENTPDIECSFEIPVGITVDFPHHMKTAALVAHKFDITPIIS